MVETFLFAGALVWIGVTIRMGIWLKDSFEEVSGGWIVPVIVVVSFLSASAALFVGVFDGKFRTNRGLCRHGHEEYVQTPTSAERDATVNISMRWVCDERGEK